jgi:flagellar basal-body rod protein FlgC
MGSLFNSIEISASGLSAQRTRMNVISANIANINTTRTEEGGPYRKKEVVFKAVASSKFDDLLSKSEPVPEKVEVVEIKESRTPFKLIYNPSHPDANEQGYVQMPNIELIEEMVDMLSATRAYEANVTVIGTAKSMINKALEISR